MRKDIYDEDIGCLEQMSNADVKPQPMSLVVGSTVRCVRLRSFVLYV